MQRCAPQQLSVYARYTRRGGLDINPFRAAAEPLRQKRSARASTRSGEYGSTRAGSYGGSCCRQHRRKAGSDTGYQQQRCQCAGQRRDRCGCTRHHSGSGQHAAELFQADAGRCRQ
jgi:hypothetical protein